MTDDNRCRATLHTARCSYERGHPLAHYSRLNHVSWTAPGETHITAIPKSAA